MDIITNAIEIVYEDGNITPIKKEDYRFRFDQSPATIFIEQHYFKDISKIKEFRFSLTFTDKIKISDDYFVNGECTIQKKYFKDYVENHKLIMKQRRIFCLEFSLGQDISWDYIQVQMLKYHIQHLIKDERGN